MICATKINKTESIPRKVFEEFQTEYMKKGWIIMSSISKALIILVITLSVLFLNKEHPFYYRAIFLWPLIFIIHVIVDKMFATNKLAHEFSFGILLIQSEIMLISGTLSKNQYYFYEMWLPFLSYWFYSGVYCFLSWRKFVLAFWIAIILYTVCLFCKYSEISFMLYISLLYSCALYPIFCMFISLKLKEMIILLSTNKDLIHTIQTILQIFPEGVIIRSLDNKSMQTIMKFANNIANKELIRENNEERDYIDTRLKIVNSDQFRNEENMSIMLNDFLSQQEFKIQNDESACLEQMIKVRERIDQLEEDYKNNRDNRSFIDNFYNVKTIKVCWNNNENSFMHVFINTTQVKKLEEERANREYQHMMFASLSHELRTPLNAFSNSLSLAQITF